MEISRYDLDNLVLFDSPGLGDGKEADQRHAKNITDKLYEKDADGKALIDLVLVILDGSTRDLGTSFELISKVILPCLKNDEKRLLVAINQADLAMKGRNWNNGENRPEPALVEFLDNKVESTKHRIKESTGVEVSVIYYAAGYKDGDKKQNPYNLAKLLVHILEHIPSKKRVVVARNINHDSEAWKINDNLADYPKEAEKSFLDSAVETIKAAAAKLWGSLQGTVIVPIADKIVEKIGTFLEQIPVEEIIKKASILLVRRFPWFR
jgi:predicted GTPase